MHSKEVRLSMTKRLSDWFRRLSRGWVALAGLLLFILFAALVLPRQSASARATAGGAGSPDTSFTYSAEDLYNFAEAYGEQGRQAYVRARYTFDAVFPLVYAFFLTTSIAWIYSRAFSTESRWQRLNLVPLLGLTFDYLENLSTSLVMLRYPQPTPVVDALAPVFTTLKWVFVGGSFVLLVLGVAVGLGRRLTRKTGPT
jgi:hypothetical protein